MADLIRIGYWRSDLSPELPHPLGLVDVGWDSDERELMVAYLRGGLPILHMMGFSPCRMCDLTTNGTAELTDGTFLWPEGLAHYVEHHAVRLPAKFERHVESRWAALEADAIRSRQAPPAEWLPLTA